MVANSQRPIASFSRPIVLAALMSALLVGGKYVLQAIANVEVVTLLLTVFTVVGGFKKTFAAAIVFCIFDLFLYSVRIDVAVSYFIFYPLYPALVKAVNLHSRKNEYIHAAVAAAYTIYFGFLTSAMNSIFYGVPFWPLYFSGTVFYAVHFVSNFILVLLCFKPLTTILTRVLSE